MRTTIQRIKSVGEHKVRKQIVDHLCQPIRQESSQKASNKIKSHGVCFVFVSSPKYLDNTESKNINDQQHIGFRS